MKNKKIQTERLRKLAMHLKSASHKDYVYQAIDEPEYVEHDDYVDEIKAFFVQPILESICVFHKDWRLNEDGTIYWKGDLSRSPYNSALRFYGLTESMFCHLFVPHYQKPLIYGGRPLHMVSSPTEIGDNILALLELLKVQAN